MPDHEIPLPEYTRWPSFPFEGDLRVRRLDDPVAAEPPRHGEDAADCVACNTPDDAYIWVSERWRVRGMDRPTGLPMVLILESRSHLDLGDLTNMLAAELGVMTVRLERAVRSLDGVARVHVNRWGDGSAHLHLWFLARPAGRLQLRGTFLSLWDDILPPIPEAEWRENLAWVAAWLAEFGGKALAEPPHIAWQSPSTIGLSPAARTEPPVDPAIETAVETTVEPASADTTEAAGGGTVGFAQSAESVNVMPGASTAQSGMESTGARPEGGDQTGEPSGPQDQAAEGPSGQIQAGGQPGRKDDAAGGRGDEAGTTPGRNDEAGTTPGRNDEAGGELRRGDEPLRETELRRA